MAQVIGVKFRNNGKLYYFSPGELSLKKGDGVVVETARGTEFGEVVMGLTEISDENVVHTLKPVLRKATADDIERAAYNRKKEQEAFPVAQKKIEERGLDMKLVDVEYAFDDNKILFYFTADGRIDFRELVRDLAGVFRTRIELRQIGVRDESKMLGGLGICGRPFCCSAFLDDFHPVSIKMAKEQGLSLNPTKISGTCGRLMCCLKYEQPAYDELLAKTPQRGCPVETPDGHGVVADAFVMSGVVKVTLDSAPDAAPRNYKLDQLTILGKCRGRKKKDESSDNGSDGGETEEQ